MTAPHAKVTDHGIVVRLSATKTGTAIGGKICAKITERLTNTGVLDCQEYCFVLCVFLFVLFF